MPVTPSITESLIRECLVKSVQNVFHTMVRQDAVLRGPVEFPAAFPASHFLGNVGFVGEANGAAYLCFSEEFANHVASEMLGMTPGEIKQQGFEVVKDVVGEVSNMTVGGFKNQLCDLGFPCKLTLPTIVRGMDVAVFAVSGSDRFVYEFDCAGHLLTADIQLKREDSE